MSTSFSPSSYRSQGDNEDAHSEARLESRERDKREVGWRGEGGGGGGWTQDRLRGLQLLAGSGARAPIDFPCTKDWADLFRFFFLPEAIKDF